MNILFYTPFNLRSRDTESLMEAFVEQGHKVFLLTQAGEGIYHEICRGLGVQVHTHVIKKGNSVLYFLKHARFLIKFCRQHKIDVLYAHLETAGLPAVMAQYFIKAKVFACRHVIDEAYLFNSKRFVMMTRITYLLAKHIIVVSSRCKDFMIAVEHVRADKIQVIFLAYNFNLYKAPDPVAIAEIKNRFPADVLLIAACRLVGPKRSELAIDVTRRLNEQGINAKLIILGSGPDFEKVKAHIASQQAQAYVAMEGFKLNIMDYLSAGDMLIHPSLSDSSSVIIKEAGLYKKVVLACEGIGDVDDYLVNGEHAVIVSKENTEQEMLDAIVDLHANKAKALAMGQSLHNIIINRFSIDAILPTYNSIHQRILN